MVLIGFKFSATPSPALHKDKRSLKRVNKQLRLDEYEHNTRKKSPAIEKLLPEDPTLSNIDEDLLLASPDSSNACSLDAMDPTLSNIDEDLLLASSDSNNACRQDAMDPTLSNSFEDSLLASSESSNACTEDTMEPILSSSEEDLLLASPDANNASTQDALDSLEDARSEAKKSV
ncbi:uncharacterized protein [Montipora capricornis]|uniref:uncharacterized protein n=1 Tax=Montipora capricornis TaxID=246305 RepID=UPI0035F1332B